MHGQQNIKFVKF